MIDTSRTRHFLVVRGNTVVAKRAHGPDAHGGYPGVPHGGVLVSEAEYRQVQLGWQRVGATWQPPAASTESRPDTTEERLARIEARLAALEQRGQGAVI